MDIHSPEFQKMAEAEIARLESDPQEVQLCLSKCDAFMLLGLLQLITRHPAYAPGGVKSNSPSARLLRAIGSAIEKEVCDSPALKIVAAAGWQEVFDVRMDA